jgi:hypothetical protein
LLQKYVFFFKPPNISSNTCMMALWQYAPSCLFASVHEETRPDRNGSEQNALYRNDGITNQVSPRNLFEIHTIIFLPSTLRCDYNA